MKGEVRVTGQHTEHLKSRYDYRYIPPLGPVVVFIIFPLPRVFPLVLAFAPYRCYSLYPLLHLSPSEVSEATEIRRRA